MELGQQPAQRAKEWEFAIESEGEERPVVQAERARAHFLKEG